MSAEVTDIVTIWTLMVSSMHPSREAAEAQLRKMLKSKPRRGETLEAAWERQMNGFVSFQVDTVAVP